MLVCSRLATLLILLLTSVLRAGEDAPAATFQFPEAAFSYANELASVYEWDAAGKMSFHPKAPRPPYTQRCFVVARSARQFLQHARFEPGEPKPITRAAHRHLIRLVLSRSSRGWTAEHNKIVVPGYANLREFSAGQEALLKAASGGAWQSYFQRGNWRMIFPFSRSHQERTAERLVAQLECDQPPIVHLVCFPSLTLNHAVLLFEYRRTNQGISFSTYDPNDPGRPMTLLFDQGQRRFEFSQTDYFAGGPVKVYEVYRGFLY